MEKIRYTLQELSYDLDISVKDLRKYVKKGMLKARKIGRSYIVAHGDLDRFLEENMDSIPRKSATRNFLCRHYDECLNRAALANKFFACDNCKKYVENDNRVLAMWSPVFG